VAHLGAVAVEEVVAAATVAVVLVAAIHAAAVLATIKARRGLSVAKLAKTGF